MIRVLRTHEYVHRRVGTSTSSGTFEAVTIAPTFYHLARLPTHLATLGLSLNHWDKAKEFRLHCLSVRLFMGVQHRHKPQGAECGHDWSDLEKLVLSPRVRESSLD